MSCLVSPVWMVARLMPVLRATLLLLPPLSVSGDGGRADHISYVALGDSIAEGVAASAGRGYVYRLRDALEKVHGQVDLLNVGQGGFTTSDLVRLLASDGELRAAIRSADLLTISIGGNHMLGCAGDNFASVDGACVAAGIQLFEREWPAILTQVREIGPTMRVLVMSLFNPYTGDDPNYREVEAAVERINNSIRDERNRARYDYEVVEVHDDFVGRLSNGRWKTCMWSGFCETTRDPHPNDAGHEEIARLHMLTYLSRL
jgi:lysophospholipase L1-like esterase